MPHRHLAHPSDNNQSNDSPLAPTLLFLSLSKRVQQCIFYVNKGLYNIFWRQKDGEIVFQWDLWTHSLKDFHHLCVSGDNGPWEQKCQYAGSVGPYLGKWQTSRGRMTTIRKCVFMFNNAELWLCVRRRLCQADHLGGGSQGTNGNLLAWKNPKKHHQLSTTQVLWLYIEW